VNVSEQVTVTLPVKFLRDLINEIPENVFQEVIWCFYYLEDLPHDLQTDLRSQGYNPDNFKLHNEEI